MLRFSSLIAATLVALPLLARADTVTTFDIVNDPVLSGNITIDTTIGFVTGGDITYLQGGTPTNIPFTGGQGDAGSTGYDIYFTSGTDGLILYITATGPQSIAGFDGGYFTFTDEQLVGERNNPSTGELVPVATPSAVPEPSTLLLLGTLTLAGALRKRISL